MATLKRRLYRKNSSGTYDIVYLETDASIITGTLPISHGGTGITSNPSMLANLGSTSAASVFATSPRPGVTGTLPVSHGGTGATTAANARTSLGITPANIGAAASSHNHSASNITSGTLPVTRGGTGVTSNPSMLVNLGSASAASVFATSPRPGVTGTLPVTKGGTGVTSLDALKDALGISSTITIETIHFTLTDSNKTFSLWEYKDYTWFQLIQYNIDWNNNLYTTIAGPLIPLKDIIETLNGKITTIYGTVSEPLTGQIVTANGGSPVTELTSMDASLKFNYNNKQINNVQIENYMNYTRLEYSIMLVK